MTHILKSLRINYITAAPCKISTKSHPLPHRCHMRRCHHPCLRATNDTPASTAIKSYDSEDDEVCGVDFITLEPIRGEACRRLREEEQHAQSISSSFSQESDDTDDDTTTKATIITKNTSSTSSNSNNSARNKNEYDFFRPTRASSPPPSTSHQQKKTPASAPQQQRSYQLIDPHSFAAPLNPSYRTSPMKEEFRKQRENSTITRILFLDEGGEFRAPLGAALLRHMLGRLRTRLDVTVDYATLGGGGGGPEIMSAYAHIHDNYESSAVYQDLTATATAMGIPLEGIMDGAKPRAFEEVADAVRYDLILVMDRFDHQEVVREVAILDALNPGGNYVGRVKCIGPFGAAARRAAPGAVVEDIADPLYDMHVDAMTRKAALQKTAQQLAFACRGVATYLLDLQSRCHTYVGGGITLRQALAQSLRCPLLCGAMPSQRERPLGVSLSSSRSERGSASTTRTNTSTRTSITTSTPVESKGQQERYTIRAINGERKVVRRSSKPRGYWKDIDNVEKELRAWMKTLSIEDRLPTQKELRAAGKSSLSSAIDDLGGLAVFSPRLGTPLAHRRPNGYWNDIKNLEHELQCYMSEDDEGEGEGEGGDGRPKRLFPRLDSLKEAGRHDIVRAINEHGGVVAVATVLGLTPRRGRGWDEVSLLQELMKLREGGVGGLPRRQELREMGRGSLVRVVDKLGGFRYFDDLLRRYGDVVDKEQESGSKEKKTAMMTNGAIVLKQLPGVEHWEGNGGEGGAFVDHPKEMFGG